MKLECKTEHDIQVTCINWFRLSYPKYRQHLFAIPNGGARNKIVAYKLKAEGVLKGVADLFLAYPSGGYHGMFIEMKKKGNYATKEQKELMALYADTGYRCEVCYSLDEFVNVIKEYML